MARSAYSEVCDGERLRIAFRQVQSAQNLEYKNYYRELLTAYGFAADQNLDGLASRLRGHSYQPSDTSRFMLPKPSGLHRPITLLGIDDLIVYQTMAAIISERFRLQRAPLLYKQVFSAVPEVANRGIFFLRKWQTSYKKFLLEIHRTFDAGDHWVGHFDISSFYASIDHRKLASIVSPSRSPNQFIDLLLTCLAEWTTNSRHKLAHGIPQGPVSSELISDIYLLPVDKAMNRVGANYLRYSDDIKIFGASRVEVVNAAAVLERECQNLGLFIEASKFSISEASNYEEAVGKQASLDVEGRRSVISECDKAVSVLQVALDRKPVDMATARYVLRSATPCDPLRDLVVSKLAQYPELASDFARFLEWFVTERVTASRIYSRGLGGSLLDEYAQGVFWSLLGKFNLSPAQVNLYVKTAFERLKSHPQEGRLRLGLYTFLSARAEDRSLPWLARERSAIMQAISISKLSTTSVDGPSFGALAEKAFRRHHYEPGLACLGVLLMNLRLDDVEAMPSPSDDFSGVLANTMGRRHRIDSIGELLRRRYRVPYFDGWRDFLGEDGDRANEALWVADTSFYANRNVWANSLDVFNELLVHKFIGFLSGAIPSCKWPAVIDRAGAVVYYGKLLDPNNQLSRNFPEVVEVFRELHGLRIANPLSHAFEVKTATPTGGVRPRVQRDLSRRLGSAYERLVQELKGSKLAIAGDTATPEMRERSQVVVPPVKVVRERAVTSLRGEPDSPLPILRP